MSKTIQTNKQTTIVNMKPSCCSRPKRRKCYPSRRYVDFEKACGSIFQKCDEKLQTYFRSIGVCVSASVTIQNDTNCDMIAIIRMKTKEITQTIRQSQQVSLVLPSISRLSIACTCNGDEVRVGRGSYTIKYLRKPEGE
ncbi:hypothetical protein A8709_23460 [Paenibacillus pectinilyticus]|uniref:Endospore appendages core domain-containing protein n=1 Tax=Paenibacillus pectinilyticus TaxID=512399 RepID=A0A1C1A8N2_9BACL|nr:S-Ena type endospore appendage [Paenibacillus pectinilyticus]OCT16962.1 hypothetical protein A8709_23460 [Paenibacillus pectinilyticus]